jgi:hypothetical protein
VVVAVMKLSFVLELVFECDQALAVELSVPEMSLVSDAFEKIVDFAFSLKEVIFEVAFIYILRMNKFSFDFFAMSILTNKLELVILFRSSSMRFTVKKLSVVQVIFLLENSFAVGHIVEEVAGVHFVTRLKFAVALLVILLVDMTQKGSVFVDLIVGEGFVGLLGQELILEQTDELLHLIIVHVSLGDELMMVGDAGLAGLAH